LKKLPELKTKFWCKVLEPKKKLTKAKNENQKKYKARAQRAREREIKPKSNSVPYVGGLGGLPPSPFTSGKLAMAEFPQSNDGLSFSWSKTPPNT
jgi:hypothetical protein